MIQKVGWDQTNGVAVTNLPSPVPGEGQKQSLSVNLPPLPANSPCLFLWLRGDDTGRSTTLKPVIPVGAPPAATPPVPKPPPVL